MGAWILVTEILKFLGSLIYHKRFKETNLCRLGKDQAKVATVLHIHKTLADRPILQRHCCTHSRRCQNSVFLYSTKLQKDSVEWRVDMCAKCRTRRGVTFTGHAKPSCSQPCQSNRKAHSLRGQNEQLEAFCNINSYRHKQGLELNKKIQRTRFKGHKENNLLLVSTTGSTLEDQANTQAKHSEHTSSSLHCTSHFCTMKSLPSGSLLVASSDHATRTTGRLPFRSFKLPWVHVGTRHLVPTKSHAQWLNTSTQTL